MFVDKARISIKAGDGGDGAVAFHREKYVAAGGPDGGDGGRGGDVILLADDNMSTLIDFRYKRKYAAENGHAGEGNNRSGKSGKDLVIRLPRGTLVREFESGSILADVSGSEPIVLAKGGKGGFGNAHFASPTRQIPRFAKTGRLGEKFDVSLELKLIADVGLVGFPNVGKSTLLSVISAARPKIANYHFTTLSPMLGVVDAGEGRSFVAADIPGLIEGAAEGVGLGHEFLRHVDRCRMLIHVVDVSGLEGRDPIEDFKLINKELAQYSERLAQLPQIVAGNKADVASREDIETFCAYVEKKGYEFFEISAATRAGVDKLVWAVADKLAALPPVVTYEPNYVKPAPDPGPNFKVTRVQGGFSIDAPWLETILATTDVDDYEALQYFQRTIIDSGVVAELEKQGVEEGDAIHIGDYEFDYVQ